MSAAPQFPLTTIVWTAVGEGALCAAVQTTSWHNQRVARALVALPVVVVLLVFTAAHGANSDNPCMTRTRDELESYLAYSLISIVFILVWLAGLNQCASRLGSAKLGVCASGALALLVWFICILALIAFVFS